MFVFNLFI